MFSFVAIHTRGSGRNPDSPTTTHHPSHPTTNPLSPTHHPPNPYHPQPIHHHRRIVSSYFTKVLGRGMEMGEFNLPIDSMSSTPSPIHTTSHPPTPHLVPQPRDPTKYARCAL